MKIIEFDYIYGILLVVSDIYHITRERVVDIYDTRSIKTLTKLNVWFFFTLKLDLTLSAKSTLFQATPLTTY